MADLRDLLAAALDSSAAVVGERPIEAFLFGDLSVALRLDRRGRIPLLLRMIEARRAEPADDSWTIDVVGGGMESHLSLLPPEARRGGNRVHATDDIYYLWLDEAGGYLTAIDRRQRRGLVWFTQPDRIASWHVARPFLHAVTGISVATPWVPIHAGAVGRNGRAVVAVGMSGAGKTSLMIASALNGFDYFGDDAMLVRPDPPTAAALFSSARVRPDMFERLAGAMPASLGVSDDSGELKAELDMALLGTSLGARASIAALIVPERLGAPQPTFSTIGRSDMLRRIMSAKRQSIIGDDRASFEKLSALVSDVPCYRFDPGPDLLAAAAALAGLLGHETTP